MRVCIHRGTKEIGGTCVEVESQGKRIVLDVGLPLDVADAADLPLHTVPGFDKPHASLLGVIISHPHQDHYGLAHRLPEETTFLVGGAAASILEAAGFFMPAGLTLKHVIPLEDRHTIPLGPFKITPYLVDHSAYDSYALLVEADGKRLFYSGDFRAHGRKAGLVERLIASPPDHVDAVLLEGTMLGRTEGWKGFPTEDDLIPQFIRLFDQTDGLVLAWASGQNIDRLVTLYKACGRARRELILDPYTLHVMHATGNRRIPHERWSSVRVFAPRSQRIRIKRDGRFDLINPLRPYRIFPEQLPGVAERSVMLFRPSMMRDLDPIEGLKIGRLICSVWRGYLDDPRNAPMLDWLKRRGVPLSHCHTSGHADRNTLKRLCGCFPEARVVPIHTQHPEAYEGLHDRVAHVNDGEFWSM